MFRFNFDFEETVQQTSTDCSQLKEAQITPYEDENGTVSITIAADCPVPSETELQVFPYDEKALTRYFIHEGWTERSSIELARGMIDRGSYLSPHEHLKYLECERQEKAP